MSVVVKGMEMPGKCGECRGRFLSGDGHVCCNLTSRIPKIVSKFNNNMMDLVARQKSINSVARPDWCPLVELPRWHGRLIDADEFDADYEALYKLNNITNSEWILFREWLRNQKTVVEAEGME